METIRTMTAWVLFLFMALAAAFFWHQSASRGRQINLLTESIKQMEGHISEMARDMHVLKEQIDDAETLLTAIQEGMILVEESDHTADDAEADNPLNSENVVDVPDPNSIGESPLPPG